MYELFTKEPLFPGKTEIEQIHLIMQDLGLPNIDKWPAYNKLPAVQKFTFKGPPVCQLGKKIKNSRLDLSDTGIHLLLQMLEYNPENRISAADALEHPWFTEAPLPTPKHLMPKFASGHEYAALKRKREEKAYEPQSKFAKYK